MTIAKDRFSRFRLSEEIIRNGAETFGLLTKYSFLDPKNVPDDKIVKFEVTPEFAGRPSRIANELYNSPLLDWVIVLFNRPLNPVNWPPRGAVINAPDESVVLPLL